MNGIIIGSGVSIDSRQQQQCSRPVGTVTHRDRSVLEDARSHRAVIIADAPVAPAAVMLPPAPVAGAARACMRFPVQFRRSRR